MITGAHIKGFKRFTDQKFTFAPMTVLAGLNGSGKTSLIQSLLLTREAASRGGATSVRLNGPFGMELGTAEDVLNWESKGNISFNFETQDGHSYEWSLSAPTEDSMYLAVEAHQIGNPAAFSERPRAFTYLSAERLGPRNFTATSPLPDTELEIGEQGQYCAHILSVLGNSPNKYLDRSHPKSDGSSARLLKYEVEQWLSEIARPVEIDGTRLPGLTVAELRFRTVGSNWVRSTNMGFGITYALPIVLAGLIAEPGALLIIENPEAHLHPAGQSRMGVFLTWLASRGIQVLLETHSDHLLNGIRRGIAELSYLPSDCAIVHWFGGFEDTDHAASVQELRISERGSISDWPKGFFDQYQLDIAALGQIRRSRR